MAERPANSNPKNRPTDDLSGSRLGDYRLIRRLGRGAMAEVYLAQQHSLKRQVALKVLKRELAADQTYIKRFRMEAQAAAAIVHPHIVQVHEVGRIDGVHFIAQEYIRGPSLHELLDRRGPLDAATAVTIMRQVASALCKASEVGIVHRDIKPENVMLTAEGDVKVADFGLARLVGDGTTRLTQVGMTMGTPLYMSPEQIEGRAIDGRSDIYSFGVTCYHVLSGAPPFEGDTPLSVAVKHLKTPPERLENWRPDLPAALCRIIHKSLAKKPEDRYADARQLLSDLRALELDGAADVELPTESLPHIAETLADTRLAATQQLAQIMSRERQRRGPARRRVMILALVLMGSFLIGGAVAWLARPPDLLADADPQRIHLEKKPTALAQYVYASTIGTPQAWQSVDLYFPQELYWVRRAEQQLARYYLRDDQHDRAMRLFEKFAGFGDEEPEFRAFGLAGKCIVLSLQQRRRQSAEVLVELAPLRDHLGADMAGMLGLVVEQNAEALGTQGAGEWREWLAERLTDEAG